MYANLCDLSVLDKLDMDAIIAIIVMLTVIYRLVMIISFFNYPEDILLGYLGTDSE